MKASEIAEFLCGELEGEDIEVVGACSLDNPKDNHVAFCKYPQLGIPTNTLTLVGRNTKVATYAPTIECDNPRLAHAFVMRAFFPKNFTARETDGATIYDCVEHGSNCRFGRGSVIGNSGFAYEWGEDRVPVRRDHVGGVVIGDNVDIGCLTTVQRGTYDNTVIEDNAKIDDRVHIGHNCHIGENTIITAGTVIAGTTKIGKNCWIGINSSIMQHITIGDNVVIGIGAVVVKDVPDNTVIAGMMAQPISKMQTVAGIVDAL